MIKINQEKRREVLAMLIRQERDRLLKECDWRSLPDYPGDRELWLNYREKLRDITEQESFPNSVQWPSIPN